MVVGMTKRSPAYFLVVQSGLFMAGLVALAFIPPLLYLLWLRSRERFDREPMAPVLTAFVYGGSFGVAIAVVLHLVFDFGYQQAGGPFPLEQEFVAAVLIAPIVEEFAKALGLGRFRRRLREVEDGIIYGAGLGLGFAATENLVYGITALLGSGFSDAFVTVVVRIFSSMLLHSSASALLGFGYGMAVLQGRGLSTLIPYYLVAVLLHGVYNFLVSTQELVGLAAAVLMVSFVAVTLRRRIEQFDRAGALELYT